MQIEQKEEELLIPSLNFVDTSIIHWNLIRQGSLPLILSQHVYKTNTYIVFLKQHQVLIHNMFRLFSLEPLSHFWRFVQYGMDLYDALQPLHFLCKMSGVATFSLNTRNVPQKRKYFVLLRDKILTSIVATTILSLGFADLSQTFRFNNIKDVSRVLTRSGYIFNSLIILTAMYLRKERVIDTIEEIIFVERQLERITNSTICYKKTRRSTLISVSGYAASLLVYTACRLFYQRSLIALYLCYYYNFFIMSASSISFLFFFLAELKRGFASINVFLKTDISKTHSVIDIRQIYQVQKLHRRLREISKEINAIFQVVVLGKLISSTIFTFTTLFTFVVSEWNTFWANGVAVGAAAWLIVIGGEICAIIYFFDSLRSEVSKQPFPHSTTLSIFKYCFGT